MRYMRNDASAAHPNQVDLTGLQLANWLETCIRQVITLPQDPITANTGRLLRNIKADRLSAADIAATASFFEELPADRADTLAAGLFGLYTDTRRTAVVADNVRLLWPELWDFVSEEARYAFGTRYGQVWPVPGQRRNGASYCSPRVARPCRCRAILSRADPGRGDRRCDRRADDSA